MVDEGGSEICEKVEVCLALSGDADSFRRDAGGYLGYRLAATRDIEFVHR